MDTKNLLEIRNLNVDFKTPRGRVHALREVSFNAPKGKIVGIVGESGSGKSTVIWAMTQLLAGNGVVEGGEIFFNGKNVLDFSEDELRAFRGEEASIVFQDPMTSQIPVLSYSQQMSDIAYRQRNKSFREKIEHSKQIMRKVGIPDTEQRVYQYPHQFSGGMRQRAGIAMALLMNPLMLIGDEPTTALDVTMEAQIIHLLRSLQEELKSTVMIVSHNLGLIAELCDEVVVMYAGEVVEQGGIRQIFHNAKHPYTQALLECDPARVSNRARFLPTIPGDLPDLHIRPNGCVFAPRCKYALQRCEQDRPETYVIEGTHNTKCHLLDSSRDQFGTSSTIERQVSKTETYDSSLKNIIDFEKPPILNVENLNVRFEIMGPLQALLRRNRKRFVDAVLDVSLHLRQGETLGLVGESGSGKTTLGRAILGLVPSSRGSVEFDGRLLTDLSESVLRNLRQDMAMMFQDPIGSLSPRKTVGALIAEPFSLHRKDKKNLEEEARKLCDMVNLPHSFLNRYPHELSGGQARRVGVARALALEPKLIIADEPTAGLDVSVQGEVLNLMRDLQARRKLSYLIVTHNLPVIRHICDRLAIMYLGRIVEQGNGEIIFQKPAHPYTEALVHGVPQPDPDKRRNLVSIEGEVPSLTNRPSGCEFHNRCKYVQEKCKTLMPQEKVLPDGRTVQCHFPLIN